MGKDRELEFRERLGVVPITKMLGTYPEETLALERVYAQARSVILDRSFVQRIEEVWFGGGVTDIVAVFLFGFHDGADTHYCWVVCGDIPIPSLFRPMQEGDSPRAILALYLNRVRVCIQNGDERPEDCTIGHYHEDRTDALERRLTFIEERVLPCIPEVGVLDGSRFMDPELNPLRPEALTEIGKSWQTTHAKDIERIGDLLELQLGVRVIEFDESAVPDGLKELLPLAHVLGIGDDGVREDAALLMPTELAVWARSRVRMKHGEISTWVTEGPWDPARSALLALTEAFGGPDFDPDATPADAATVDTMIEFLKNIKL